MGRYDGEDYEDRGWCEPGKHNIAPNGTCWICHHTPSDEPQVVMELPCFLPETGHGWTEVRAKAIITKSGEIHIKLRDPEDAVRLVEMAKDNTLYQVSFDYRMPIEVVEKIKNRFQSPVYDGPKSI